MKYNISSESHSAEVEIIPGSKGGFSGTISNTDYGSGTITNGVQSGQSLSGDVSLDGHACKFTATVSGTNITGTISTHIFLLGTKSAPFTGTQAA